MSELLGVTGQVELLLRDDARAALRQTRELLDRAPVGADDVDYHHLLLLKGAAQARVGETADGARLMREVKAWAEDHDETDLLARTHRRLAALFRRVGDPALMLEHSVAAVDLLDPSAGEALRADHLIGLADALGANGDFVSSIARYQEASALIDSCGDRYLRLRVLNNLAFTQYEAGLDEEALLTAELLQTEAAADGETLQAHDCDTIARAYSAVGRFDEAIAVLVPVCEAEATGEDCDGKVMALLTLTEVYRLAGQLDAAQSSLDEGSRLIELYALTGQATEAQHERAQLAAARGDYRAAYEAFRDFHTADARIRGLERDARARTLHAIFEADEARRSRDHFRELSVRDPLTGLHNRRHLDSRLEELLDRVGHDGVRLTVGLLDLDYFKRINDTFSHAVGDEVLRAVAGLLQTAALGVEGGVAARVGGEEFLILLPGVDRAEATQHLDTLRRAIATHGWSDLGSGITLTASIGMAAAPEDGLDRAALLAHADDNLYSAKRNGRNCVVAAPSTTLPAPGAVASI